MVTSRQSKCHICGMNLHAPTQRVPCSHYDSNVHSTVDPQAPKATRAPQVPSSFPTLSTSLDNMCKCHNNTDKTRSRQTVTPNAGGLAATSYKTHEDAACLANSNSPTACSSATETQITTLQPVVLHDRGTQTPRNQTPPHVDTFIPPPAFVSTRHTRIRPGPHDERAGLPALLIRLNSRNAFPDPWSSEVAHTFPSSVRLEVLANTLENLEPLLDFPSNTPN